MTHRNTVTRRLVRAARRLSRHAGLLAISLVALLVGCRSPDGRQPARIIAFGDSMTAGPTARSYPDFLAAELATPPDTIVSAGRSGETSSDGLKRLSGVLRKQARRNSGVLIYWEGGNDMNRFIRRHDRLLRHDPGGPDYPYARPLKDALSAIERNIVRAVRTAERRRLAVYVVTYPPVRASLLHCDAMPGGVLLAGQARHANRYVDLLNARIRRAAAAGGARVMDVAAAFPADADNYHDCIHPSEAGQKLIAAVMAEALRERGGTRFTPVRR